MGESQIATEFYAAACRLRLSEREAKLAAMARSGLSTAEAACQLGISTGTANKHYERARRKTNATTKVELVAIVYDEILRRCQ